MQVDEPHAAGEAGDRIREPLLDGRHFLFPLAPKLQRVLASALEQGGWFAESHDDATVKAAGTEDQAERLTAVRTLLAEETRMGMLVGVAVGWALATELTESETEDDE